MIKMCAIKWSK